jgi:hypothetical protein
LRGATWGLEAAAKEAVRVSQNPMFSEPSHVTKFPERGIDLLQMWHLLGK